MGAERAAGPSLGTLDPEEVRDGWWDRVEAHRRLDPVRIGPWDVHDERDMDEFLVELGVVGEVPVFLELFAVVTHHHDRRLVGSTALLDGLEQPPDARVDLADRRLIQHPEVAQRPGADLPAEAGPGVGVQHPVGSETVRGDLADVPRCGDVRRVGVHVVDPEETRVLARLDEIHRRVLDVEHPRGIEERAVRRVPTKPRTQSAHGRGRELEPRLDGRMGGEVSAVDARADARHEGVEVIEALVVAPVRGEKPIGGVVSRCRDAGVAKHRREGGQPVDTDRSRLLENGLRGQDGWEGKRRPVALGVRPVEDGPSLGQLAHHRCVSVLVVGLDRVRPERIDRYQHHRGDVGVPRLDHT